MTSSTLLPKLKISWLARRQRVSEIFINRGPSNSPLLKMISLQEVTSSEHQLHIPRKDKIRFLEFHLNDSLKQDYPHLSTHDPCDIKYGRAEQVHRELLKRAEIWTQIWTRRILALLGDKAKLAMMSQNYLTLACFEEDKSKMYHCKLSHTQKHG